MQRFIAGFFAALVVIALAGFVTLKFGLLPATADQKPDKLERRVAQMALDATIAREAPKPPYPYQSSDADVVAGAKLYMEHCAMCHGGGVGKELMLSRGLYIRPPQFAEHGVDDDPEGVTYWKIEHGVRFTGMPSYKGSLTEKQIWQIAFFLKIPAGKLPPAAAAIFNKQAAE